MRKHKKIRRLLSLLLAGQLLCAQIPVAAAAELLLEEDFLIGQEEMHIQEISLDGDGSSSGPQEVDVEVPVTQQAETPAYYYSYQLGFGVGIEYNEYEEPLIGSHEHEFQVEVAKDADNYGSRDYTQVTPPLFGTISGTMYTFAVFPSEAQLGRVPDKRLEGWYVYPKGSELTAGLDILAWQYDDTLEENGIETSKYPPENLDFTPYENTDYTIYGDEWNIKMEGGTVTAPDYAQYGYTDTYDVVQLVGRWVPSDIASARGVTLTTNSNKPVTLYGQELAGEALPETSVTFTPETTEYWARVGYDVDKLDLTFLAYELYYDYIEKRVGNCPVTVTVNGEAWEVQGATMPEEDPNAEAYRARNSVDNPAHSKWTTLEQIPLEVCTQEEGKTYNDIVITVTSPDGKNTATYTFHVQRLARPGMTLKPGNTPIGMIERDTSSIWDPDRDLNIFPNPRPEVMEVNKDTAKAYFEEHDAFHATYFPQDAQSQQGSVFKGNYRSEAWVGANGDRDPNALVIYQDSVALDPGLSLTGTEGETVDLTQGKVYRSLKLRTADALTTDLVGDGLGTECWYSGGALVDTETWETISDANGSQQIDLRGLNVLPGIYTLEYRYNDPVSDQTYPDPEAEGKDVVDPTLFSRTVIVLPVPGDVDMDGAVTAADALALERAVDLSTNVTQFHGRDLSTDATAALFAYRVCNLDHNNTIDENDRTILEQGYFPVLENMGDSDYHYIPLPTGETGERYTRTVLDETPRENTAQLSLEFLGVEDGTRQESGAVTDPVGPQWNGLNDDDLVELDDTFWVGVKLSDSAKSSILNQGMDAFTFTLTYDAKYVKPVSVLNSDMFGGAEPSEEERWKSTMRIYNLGSASQTVWGTNYEYQLTDAAIAERPFSTHYSKAITPLESGADEGTELRELVFSIRLEDTGTPVTLRSDGDLWLLAAPFQLVKHPFGQKTIQAVEMGAGMRDFVFVSQNAGLTAVSDGGEAPVAAYSVQEEIFGDATANLRGSVSHNGAGVDIPLGEDHTVVTLLYNQDGIEEGLGPDSTTNARYSKRFFTSSGGALPDKGNVEGTLPPGIEYDNGELRGYPEVPGTYDFTIAGEPYRIIVEKLPLYFWADDQASYYGQSELRGDSATGFTFSYRTADIGSLDKNRAGADAFDGKGANLATLLGEKSIQPGFKAVVDEAGTPVSENTPVDSYKIDCWLTPELKNYEMIYDPTKAPTNLQGLTILPRPFLVNQLVLPEGETVGSIYSDEAGTLSNLTATLGTGTQEGTTFVAQLPETAEGEYDYHPLSTQEGYTDGVLLPGDTLSITYKASYIHEEKDMNGEGNFVLESNQPETRKVEVYDIVLEDTEDAANYKLVSSRPVVNGKDAEVMGTVLRRNIERLEIEQLPPMTYQYGDQLTDPTALLFYIVKGSGSSEDKEGIYRYDPHGDNQGIQVTWVTEETMEAGGADGLPYEPNPVFTVEEHHGRYLCVSTSSVDKEGKPITIVKYSEDETGKPLALTVTPLTLTLTADPVERYYGEENGTLTYRYDTTQLALHDRRHDSYTGAGTGEELEEILAGTNFIPPTLTAQVSLDPEDGKVDASTPWTGAKNYIVISPTKDESESASESAGESEDEEEILRNYSIQYARADGTTSAEWGYSDLVISKRLIVVDKVTTDRDLLTLYADTKQIYTENLSLKLGEVAVSLPTHNATGTTYFPRYGTDDSNPVTNELTYAKNVAILDADKDKLSLTYTGTMISTDGEAYIWHGGFSKGYFNMDGEEDGTKEYDVQVSELALVGEAANNYGLVYKNNGLAINGLPNEVRAVNSAILPEKNDDTTYYAAGKGTVRLRPIQSIEIISPPKTVYTYGDPFAPGTNNAATRQPLTVSLNYATEGDNFAGNTTSETVRFIGTGVETTSFSDRNLTIYWVKAGQTVDEAIAAKQVLEPGDPLTVTEHHGARLVVRGQRGAGDPVTSAPTTETLTISARTLTLTAGVQHRVYGEPNSAFAFTFAESQLAPMDQAALNTLREGEDGEKYADSDGVTLAKLAETRGLAYTAPTMTTTATPSSPVLNGGAGSYPITLSGGSLANYTLTTTTEGQLHIHPRNIRIKGFNSSPEAPLYMIFTDTTPDILYTNVSNLASASFTPTFTAGLATGPSVGGKPLPMTGDAIYGNDEVILRIALEFGDTPYDTGQANASKTTWPVEVTGAWLVAGTDAANNYTLDQSGGGATIEAREGVGIKETRNVTEIRISSPPADLKYTYGDSLDLSGLAVNIVYGKIDNETVNPQRIVPYVGTDQFAQYGLYVNYSTNNTVPDESEWEDLIHGWRRAETGDHLTVAPTHDTQDTQEEVEEQKGFSANEKYLIISAKLEEKDDPAKPQIVQTPITVEPLALTFTLSAEDKTYDGETEAAGTVELTNVFRKEGVVDRYHEDGVVDQVYVVTGADYEANWGYLWTGYEDFKDYVDQNDYVFTTGEYVPADPAPLGKNYDLEYTKGYDHGAAGALTFHFLDPNVAYVTEPTHDNFGPVTTIEVEATGITLGGPDAANYTIVPQVTEDDLADATAKGYLGSGLPQATIHKANRAKLPENVLPQVEVDVHTNVVKLTYDQTLDAIEKGEAEEYRDELHFEYALQYDATQDGQAALAQWAGADGAQYWEDGKFFGGEAYAPQAPEGYVPDPEDIPTAEDIDENTIYRGQIYRWSGEDSGFAIDDAAYPGGERWLTYDLYATERSALPRDTVLVPVVRAAETHNYHASPVLSGVAGYTPELAQAVADTLDLVELAEQDLLTAATDDEIAAAQAALKAAQTEAANAAAAALEAIDDAAQAARDTAQAEADRLVEIAGEGQWPEEGLTAAAPAPAVKTYLQRLDVVSVEEAQIGEGASSTDVTVPTLEAVWFTDVLDYPEESVMDAVLRNMDPTRYRGYYWDAERSAQVEFENDDQVTLSLAAPLEVEVERKDAGGNTVTETITVNKDHIALLYANISGGSSLTTETGMRIEPGSLTAAVGDAPRQLKAVFTPAHAVNQTVTWSSSDPTVAQVDKNGLVTFVGPGTAIITAVSVTGSQASITVTVLESWGKVYPRSIFDVGYLYAFFTLEDGFFYPELGMTRGEVAQLLMIFYVPNPNWTGSGSGDFPDLTGREPYAEAARTLGELGVFMGVENGDFAGEEITSRAEFVTLLTRMLGLDLNELELEPAFADAGPEDTWAWAYIAALAREGVVEGVGGDRFAPARPITRSESAVMLDRALINDALIQKSLFPQDVGEEHWAYQHILRALNSAEDGWKK